MRGASKSGEVVCAAKEIALRREIVACARMAQGRSVLRFPFLAACAKMKACAVDSYNFCYHDAIINLHGRAKLRTASTTKSVFAAARNINMTGPGCGG